MNRVRGIAKVAPMIGMRSQNPEDGVSRMDATGYNWPSSQDSSVRLWGKTYRVGEEDASRRSSAYVDTGYIDEDGRRKREGGRRGEL